MPDAVGATAATDLASGPNDRAGSAREVLSVFLRLGLTSFGGPIAHLGYFRSDLVERRKWVDEKAFADLVALCQVLPGPASSQVAVGLGMRRAGLRGGVAAWLGFSMPSALALVAFAYGVDAFGDLRHAAWIHGLKLVAVAVVAQAVWGMGRKLCPDRSRATLAVAALAVAFAVPSSLGQIGAIALGAVIGRWLLPLPPANASALAIDPAPSRHRPAVAALLTFVVLLVALQLASAAGAPHLVRLVDAFYRSGALVFGGGHVVLPLLQHAVVVPGWISNDAFLAGYGAAQAVPGPLFTFAAYLGAAMRPAPHGVVGGLLCLIAIYLPSFLLLIGVLPFWDGLRMRPRVQTTLAGVNAAVVGLLLAALYDPVWTSAVHSATDFGLVLAAFLALTVWKVAPWAVVAGGAVATQVLASTIALS